MLAKNQDFDYLLTVMTTIQDLPQEVLLKVFSYFKPHELCRHVVPVCRDWHSLAFDKSLWHRLDLSKLATSGRYMISGLDLCRLVLRVPVSIQELILHGMVEELTPAELVVIAENCPELTYLDLGFVGTVNCSVINSVLTSCPKLQYLNVEGCKNVNHEFIREIVMSAGAELKKMNFSHCPLVDESINLLAEKLSKIKSLNIDGISWITDRAINTLVRNHKETLEHLELDGAELTDYSIAALSTCRHLVTLSISFCELLSDASLIHLSNLPLLQKLCLRKGLEFTSEGMAHFLNCQMLSLLQHLDLSECPNLRDDGVQALTHCCGRTLKTLNLSWCWEVTDVGWTSIVDRCRYSGTTIFRILHNLSTRTILVWECFYSALYKFGACLNSLVRLTLVGLYRLTGSCLDRIPEDMPHLKRLDLQQCNLINDSVLEEIVRRKADLVIINYYGETFVNSKCTGEDV